MLTMGNRFVKFWLGHTVGVLDLGHTVGVLDLGYTVGVLDLGYTVGVLDLGYTVGVLGLRVCGQLTCFDFSKFAAMLR